ncbi:MAG: hypothetical protein SFU99_09770 [Saprospiraceae bacterium]|nr:hypothetical protein [Saprospiraceae bacterium]
MKKLFLGALALSMIVACNLDSKQADSGVRISCEALNGANTNGMPQNAVYAIIGEQKTKLMDINADCMQLEPENYDGYGIPADAVAVSGSWFAGLGDYFYAKQEGEKIVFYHAIIMEEAPQGGIKYSPIATYEGGKMTVHELK